MKNLSFMVAAILVLASAPKVLMAAPAAMAEQTATEDVVDYTIDWTKQGGGYNMWAAPNEIGASLKDYISVSAKDGLTVKNDEGKFSNYQFQLGKNVPLKKGTDYFIKIVMKGSIAGQATVSMGQWGNFGTTAKVEFTDQYKTYTLPYTSAYEGEDGFIRMECGKILGTINVKSVEVVHKEKATTRYNYELATVDYAGGATAAGGWGKGFDSKIVDGACVISHGETTNSWDAQVNFENVYPMGATIKLSMEVKGSVEGSIKAGLQNPNGWKGCGVFPDINLTTDYRKVELSTVCIGECAKRLLLDVGAYSGTVYIKNLKIEAEGVKQETVTISPSGYSTYAAYYPVDYSKLDLKAYAVKLNDAKNGVEFTEISGVVPAGVPVLLKGEANKTYVLDKAEGGDPVSTDLKVSDGTSASSDAATLYALATVNGVTAFYPVKKNSAILLKRCYLEVKDTSASKAAFYSLGTNSSETTGISSVENKVEKADAPVYNLAGQPVGKGYKGLVIKNGKKFVIK